MPTTTNSDDFNIDWMSSVNELHIVVVALNFLSCNAMDVPTENESPIIAHLLPLQLNLMQFSISMHALGADGIFPLECNICSNLSSTCDVDWI